MTDTLALRKARGAFYTPNEISRFLTNWAIRESTDVVLEPSCGDASILSEAGLRLRKLGASKRVGKNQLHGVEIHQSSAKNASARLSDMSLDARVAVANFFDIEPKPVYDSVIGNPPYIRYQQFSGENRIKGIESALSQGVRLPGLASSWAPFVIHSARFLKPAGRLALVLPAELLTVIYAAQIRRFLLNRFGNLRLVLFEKRVFPGVLADVVLLLAEGNGGTSSFEVFQARDLSDLPKPGTRKWKDFTPETSDKWTAALIDAPSFITYQKFLRSTGFASLDHWGQTYLGSVTGNNSFFTLTRDEANALRLHQNDLLKISPPGTRHLCGLQFSTATWTELAKENRKCFLFYPNEHHLSKAVTRYIEEGRKRKIDKGYKCANRNPWWKVPLVNTPDLFLTYMNHDRPRFVWNSASVKIINSVYGISLKHGKRTLGRKLLPLASLNSVTLLGSEVIGRSYGGGLSKLEPREADQLPIPTPELLGEFEKKLCSIQPQLATYLRSGNLDRAVEMVDRIILLEAMKATTDELSELRQARQLMFGRRKERNRKDIGKD